MLLMVLLGTGSTSLVSLGKELCALDPQELEESFTLVKMRGSPEAWQDVSAHCRDQRDVSTNSTAP